jgi:ribosomal-protein-alanine N-acetyltransferase
MMVVIRECRMGDIKDILKIENLSFDDPYPESLFLSFLSNFPEGFRIAESSGSVVGYCVILPWKGTASMVLTSLAVSPQFRRNKIGTRLVEDAMEIARKRKGVKKIFLQVSSGNIQAQRLYSRFGFVKTRILDSYYGNGKDGVEMSLELVTSQS